MAPRGSRPFAYDAYKNALALSNTDLMTRTAETTRGAVDWHRFWISVDLIGLRIANTVTSLAVSPWFVID